MWTPAYTKKIEKSISRCKKRGYDIDLFKNIALILIKGLPLPQKYQPHKLSGEFTNIGNVI